MPYFHLSPGPTNYKALPASPTLPDKQANLRSIPDDIASVIFFTIWQNYMFHFLNPQ